MRPRSFERGKFIYGYFYFFLNSFCFNEAAFFRTRKANAADSDNDAQSWRFNEAAFFRTRKGSTKCANCATTKSFNEAAFFRTRKANKKQGKPPFKPRASMRPRSFERGKACGRFAASHLYQASMRPRSFERGKMKHQRNGNVTAHCFNEAAFFRTRKEERDSKTNQIKQKLQ